MPVQRVVYVGDNLGDVGPRRGERGARVAALRLQLLQVQGLGLPVHSTPASQVPMIVLFIYLRQLWLHLFIYDNYGYIYLFTTIMVTFIYLRQ